ncbi:type II secretion system F family protein [Corynebacterium sp. H78]|uniref:type II secretion system F family protein n=1 Tax=Corynebacterium sp. H78 TaxID=3133417 RepID=UPI0030A17FDC
MITALLVAAVAVVVLPARDFSTRCPELVSGSATADTDAATALRIHIVLLQTIRRALPARLDGWITVKRADRARRHANPAALLEAATILDLVAACVKAGMTTSAAIHAVSLHASPRLGEPLRAVAGRLALGAPGVWESLIGVAEFAEVAVIAKRSIDSGTALSEGIEQLAASHRRVAGDAAEAMAERAGVLIAGPLALCFLPAFVAIGLVPTIAGLAETMFSDIVPGGG